jgi:tRNA modification GTPase
MQDTIFALATGSLACAISVIRVSGPRAADIGKRFCSVELRAREARYCHVRDPFDHELIDSGLVLFFKGPASFTGEDSVEFQLHGSRAVVARMLQALKREPGVRMAQPGEFIRRAFDSGKLALTSVEGVADLIDAKTDLQRKQALAQAAGGLASKATQWREMLLDALALVTAEIDFADEGEAPTEVLSAVRSIAGGMLSEFRGAVAEASRGETVRNGFRVVLCGPPNVGKSTLMNALAKRDLAIVTEHAGTTRDVIEIELDLGGLPILLSDTAGLRDTSDAVEAIGVQRSRQVMESADLVLWLSDAAGDTPAHEVQHERLLVVATKTDQAEQCPDWADIGISAKDGIGLTLLIDKIAETGSRALAGESPLVTNARQLACVETAARHIERLMADDVSALEFVADDLLRCADALQDLVGRIGTEDVLESVFTRFCMGK